MPIDFDTVAKNVGSSTPGDQKVVLNTATFSYFLKGPSVAGIEEAFKRIGITNFDWDNVGKVGAVQGILGTAARRETKSG